MPTLFRKPLIICFVSLYTAVPVLAKELDNLRAFVKIYESQGKLKQAYQFALLLAEKDNNYPAWSELAKKYATFDSTGTDYLQAWRLAAQIDQIDTYRDFLTIRPGTIMNLHAIHAIYRLTRATNNIKQLAWFIEVYPDSLEAIAAVLAIYELAFNKSKQLDDPEVYDAFVATFPEAKQVPEAMELALQVELRQLQIEVVKLDPAARERLARQILNKGRKAEYEANIGKGTEAPEHSGHIVPILSARKYELLLKLPAFEDTEVLTSLLDRHERVAYQKLLLAHLDVVANKIEATQNAIVDALTIQTEVINHQTEVITELNKDLLAQIQEQTKVIEAGNKDLLAQLQKQTQVITEVGNSLVTEMHSQTKTLTEAIGKVETAVNTQGERIVTAVGRVEASVNNVGILLDAHNQLMDQQLAMIQNPGVALGTTSGGGQAEAGIADGVISAGVATACEYAGNAIGAVAGAYASGGTAAVVGAKVGGIASRYACEAIGKLAQKVKAKIAAITKPIAKVVNKAVNAVKKGWSKVKSWFSDSYVPKWEQQFAAIQMSQCRIRIII